LDEDGALSGGGRPNKTQHSIHRLTQPAIFLTLRGVAMYSREAELLALMALVDRSLSL